MLTSATASAVSDTTINANMRFGQWTCSTSQAYNGLIDEPAIYNHALSSTEINAVIKNLHQ